MHSFRHLIPIIGEYSWKPLLFRKIYYDLFPIGCGIRNQYFLNKVSSMIKWASKPDPVFYDIISNALEYYLDNIKDELLDDDNMAVKVFGRNGLVIELGKIISAHNSKRTFTVTDYHFLILYDALALYCDLYNDDFFEEISLGGIHPSQLDFELMVDMYFWDTDFLFDQEIINNLSVDQKNEMNISTDVFSIANNLTPHAEELKLSETGELEPVNEIFYKNGEPYPYLDEIDKY